MAEETPSQNFKKATFGMGCFWCAEAVFQKLKGVESVVSGYAGGTKEGPSYEEVSTGGTGHAEVVQIIYDSRKISYEELLEVFWSLHDPTTPNRQGDDVGPQYRSVILYHDEKQKTLAEKSQEALSDSGKWKKPVVTEIRPLEKFYKAEEYHQNYYHEHPQAPYCQVVIRPKVEKTVKLFHDKLKKK